VIFKNTGTTKLPLPDYLPAMEGLYPLHTSRLLATGDTTTPSYFSTTRVLLCPM